MVGKLSGKYLDQQSEILNSLLLLFLLNQVLTKYTETTTSFYVIESFFFKKKTKTGTELVSLPPFLHEFWQKYFSCFLFTAKSQYNFWDIRQYVYCNCFLPSFLHHKFSNNLSFLIKPLSYMTKKVRKKFKEWKELSRWNKNHFSSIWEGFHWNKQNQLFLKASVWLQLFYAKMKSKGYKVELWKFKP